MDGSTKAATNKKLIAVIAFVLAVTALIVAVVSCAVLIPKMNELKDSSTSDDEIVTGTADEARAANCRERGRVWDRTLRKCVLSTTAPTEYPTYPTLEPTTSEPSISPLVDVTMSPTTRTPTKYPTSMPTEPNVIIDHNYTYTTTTEYYDCDCQCPTDSYGVLNAGLTHEVGGYYGWEWNWQFPDLYPLADLHVYVYDTIKFIARDWTPDDVWLINEDVYNSCNFTDKTNLKQLTLRDKLRGDCEVSYWTPKPCGYEFLIQEWHLREYGIFLFLSVR